MTAAVAPGARDARHVPGEAGLWVLILGEMSMFAIYFAMFLLDRQDDVPTFRAGQQTLSQGFGAINTVVLLTSSLLVYVALAAVRRGDHVLAPKLFAGALVLAGVFYVVKAFEWSEKLSDGIVPTTDDFYGYYFVITGLHLAHVVVGMAVLAVLLVRSRRPDPTAGQLAVIEGGAVWWHMVDLNWMLLFPLLYLVH